MRSRYKFPVLPLIILLGLLSPLLQGEPLPPEQAEDLREEARQLLEALVSANYETIADLTYPPLVAMNDDRETFLRLVRDEVDRMADRKLKPTGYEVGQPEEIVAAGTEMHSLVPYVLILESPTQIIKIPSYLLAIQQAGAANWSFLDGRGLNERSFGMILPHFNSALNIPLMEEPLVKSRSEESGKQEEKDENGQAADPEAANEEPASS